MEESSVLVRSLSLGQEIPSQAVDKPRFLSARDVYSGRSDYTKSIGQLLEGQISDFLVFVNLGYEKSYPERMWASPTYPAPSVETTSTSHQ